MQLHFHLFPFKTLQPKLNMKRQLQKLVKNKFFIFLQRGISIEKAVELMISGFVVTFLQRLPMEFAAEAISLLSLKLEGKCRLMNTTPILEIENLNASINDNEILNNLNLKIYPGEIHAIMGPNGSGKSTFSKVISWSSNI